MRTQVAGIVIAILTPFLGWAQIPAQPQLPQPTEEQIKAAAAMPFRDPALPIPQRVDDLVSRMTLEEKVSQVIDRAAPIPRLDVPAYNWWNEGLHGIARSGYATMFPQAIGNAATWDAPLLDSIGAVISTEARAKYNDAIRRGNHDRYFGLTIWSPNINIFRDPRWGRGQETYGEDPFLTATLGTAFVKGIQGDDPNYLRAIATPKHYAVHSGPESTRHQVDIEPSEHDLWDTYLPAFRALITEGKADSIMCAYNSVDHAPDCANKMLLQQILREDWGFQGYVTSDCDAIDDFSAKNGHHYSTSHETGSAAGIEAGTDTDCGTSYLALTDAVHHNLIPVAELDVAVKRLFTARMRLGMFDPPQKVPFSSIPFSVVNSPENAALALRASRESMVLLKNDGHFLPLKTDGSQTIAVIGPLAASRIDNSPSEYADELDDLGALGGIGRHAHEQQLSLAGVIWVQLAYVHDVDELVELCHNLFERGGLDVYSDRYARKPVVVGRRDSEGEDAVPTSREQSCDARQHTGPVLYENRQNAMTGALGWVFLAHCDTSAVRSRCDGCTTMSSLGAPAGTIGKTCSIESVRKSITTGRSSMLFALSIAGVISSMLSTRIPTQPIEFAHPT